MPCFYIPYYTWGRIREIIIIKNGQLCKAYRESRPQPYQFEDPNLNPMHQSDRWPQPQTITKSKEETVEIQQEKEQIE